VSFSYRGRPPLSRGLELSLTPGNIRIVFHRTTAEVSARLAVATVDDPSDAPEALYCEKGLDGYTVVTPNTDDSETRIDLLLFKAVTTESRKVEAVFAWGGSR
jgi:hypothetical protein